MLKRNFHLKGSLRAEFAVVSCSVALEQCNCARTCKDLAQEMSLLEQPIYRSIFPLCLCCVMCTGHGLPQRFTIRFFRCQWISKSRSTYLYLQTNADT